MKKNFKNNLESVTKLNLDHIINCAGQEFSLLAADIYGVKKSNNVPKKKFSIKELYENSDIEPSVNTENDDFLKLITEAELDLMKSAAKIYRSDGL